MAQKSFSLQNLLWVDCLAALSAGLLVFLLKPVLSPFFGLSENLLSTQSIISFCYAAFSFSLARRGTNRMFLLKTLVFANLAYAILCLAFLVFFFKAATIFGVIYLLVESLFVVILAVFEWRKIQF